MRKLTFLLFVLLLCGIARAQQPTQGFPPYGVFTNGNFDSVNLEDLNVTFSFPITSPRGRGISTGVAITYNSNFYYRSGGISTWSIASPVVVNSPLFGLGQQQSTYGWNFGIVPALIEYDPQPVTCNVDGASTTYYSNFRYTDTQGTTHTFDGVMYDDATACNYSPAGSMTGNATDGSGWYISGDSGTQTVYTPAGVSISSLNPSTATDTNGNYTQASVASSATQYTDSLGHLVVTIVHYADHLDYQVTDSSGTPQHYTLSFQRFNVRTNFACQNIAEYTAQAQQQLPVSLVLPNGRSYAFSYEDTPGWPGWTTARLRRVTLENGGYFEYVYPNTGNGGVFCDINYIDPPRLVTLTRNINDGATTQVWNYGQVPTSQICQGQCAHNWKTKVTPPQLPNDPAPNESTYSFTFVPYPYSQQIDAKYYRGLETGNQLLRTVTTIKSWDKRPISVTVTLENNQQSKTEMDWNSDNQLLEKREFDWGVGAPGLLVRRTTSAYLSTQPYADRRIRDRTTQKIVKNGSGNIVARKDFAYDTTPLACVTGAANHDDLSYGCTFTIRGNLTSQTAYSNASAGSGALTETMTYDSLGNLRSELDPAGNVTSFDYTDNFTEGANHNSYGYATKVTYPVTGGVAHIERKQFFWNTALIAVFCGQNFPTGSPCANTYSPPQPDYTKYTYDLMNRPLTITRGDGGVTSYSYNDLNLPPSATTTTAMNGTQNVVNVAILDGLGRPTQTRLNSDPDCASGDRTDATYDALGRVATVSNPYCTTSDPTYGLTTYTYDALGRTTQVQRPGGATVLYTYSGRSTRVQDEDNGTSRVTRISQTDALGSLVSLCEVSSASLIGSVGTPAACGQDIPATGFLTAYQYDALGNLLQVNQGGISPRIFEYDSLSRLNSASNPESGTIAYTYDANGNLTTKTDARGIITTYSYDALNRLTSKTYSDGTPAATFNYDQTSALGVPLTNTIGRKSSESTAGPSPTGAVFGYDQMGRVVDNSQCSPQNCGSGVFPFQYTQYDFLGDLLSATDALGVSFNYTYSTAARLTTMTTNFIDGSHPGTLFSNAHYSPFGSLTGSTLGNTLNESLNYDNRLRFQSYAASSGTTTPYSFNLTFAANGDVTASNDSVNGNWTYSYDDFNRLVGANQNSGQAIYGYVYDRFGNRWQQNGPNTMILTFTGNNPGNPQNNNRMDGYSYDAAGNLLNDGTTTYTYDAENRIISATSNVTGASSYVYDAEGQRVRKTNTSAGSVDYLYDLGGNQTAEISAAGVYNRGELYLGSRHLVTYTAGPSGSTFFIHGDWLNTERARTDVGGAVYETCTSVPFGDALSCSSADISPLHFTGKERDSESGLDHTLFRQYSSSLGRWTTPDPFAGYADNPQSLNRYAYVLNTPTSLTDPFGLCDDNCKQKAYGYGSELNGMVGGHCVLDHIDAECSAVISLVRFGGADVCPNNDCSNVIKNTGHGFRVMVPEGYLVLNCVGESLSSYGCFWATWSVRFVQGGNDIYFVGDARWKYMLGTAAGQGAAGVKAAMFATSPEYLFMAGAGVVEAAPAVGEAAQAAGRVVTAAERQAGSVIEARVPGGVRGVVDFVNGYRSGGGLGTPRSPAGMAGVGVRAAVETIRKMMGW